MEMEYEKKKSSVLQKLESYLSFVRRAKASQASRNNMFTPSKSVTNSRAKTYKRQVTPTGCFSVYVGPQKERFVIKTEFANHPLFKMLLEDAELEYGFDYKGPLLLPCEVDLFCKILAEMDSSCKESDDIPGCGFPYGSCSPFSPARRLGKGAMAKAGCSSYDLLTPPQLLKINHY